MTKTVRRVPKTGNYTVPCVRGLKLLFQSESTEEHSACKYHLSALFLFVAKTILKKNQLFTFALIHTFEDPFIYLSIYVVTLTTLLALLHRRDGNNLFTVHT